MRTFQELSPMINKIINLLNKCASPTHIHQIQSQIILHHLHSNTTLAYHFITASQNVSLLHSCLPLFFTHLHRPHVFICNTLIRAFSRIHDPHIPYSIYIQMHYNSILPNNYTFPFLFKSLSDCRDYLKCQCVHAHVIRLGHLNDIYVQNSLLDVYASCGYMGLCREVFDEMSDRDVVSWTVLIMGYRNAKNYADALIAFEKMHYAGVVPNRVTMVNALGACGSFRAIEMGVWIHDFISRNGWDLDVILGTSLVEMYLKCGRIDEGLNAFRSMKEKNVFTWNVVIQGLGFAKSGQEAVWWFNRMEEEGFEADEVTLANVLNACIHSGLVDVGRQIFSSLINGSYGFSPSVKHYACMIDLLTRAGCLDEAFKLIKEMPFEPSKSIWGSFLTGCRACGNLELSELAAKKLAELESDNGTYFVSSI
ncbi:putative pentatricopeptide repeat-containing protein At3g28640 [Populus alba]